MAISTDPSTESSASSPDPRAIAQAVLLEVADEADQVGDFITVIELEDHVSDFRFAANIRGYEGWQWSVTLFHDQELDNWTVNESSLIPTEQALLPPKWVPWKDRLEPTDLGPTDSIGTAADDERVEPGDVQPSSLEDVNDAVETFRLTRRRVLSPLGRAQAAKRWYDGPRGPKALSTKTADGNTCSTCGFFVPLAGELDRMFGVCANKWSPDDGRVVSLDHGCGEHSEIEPPEPTHLWVQSKPAFDDLHIDVVAHRQPAHDDDEQDTDDSEDATEEDIIANTEIDAGDDDGDEIDASAADEESVSPELEVVVDLIEKLRQSRAEKTNRHQNDAGDAAEDETSDAPVSEPISSDLAEATSSQEAEPTSADISVDDANADTDGDTTDGENSSAA